jgi:uncharacterized membrane protein
MTTATTTRNAGIVLAAATVAMGLIAGLYFGWGVAVMPGLAGLDDRAFVDAAQHLDDAIRNPLFFGIFAAGFALTGAGIYLAGLLGARRAIPWIVAALVLYGIQSLITMGIHEPLNQDIVNAGDPSRIADPASVRDAFEDEWVAWHIVRTFISTAAVGCLAYALLLHGRHGRPALATAATGDSRRGATSAAGVS